MIHKFILENFVILNYAIMYHCDLVLAAGVRVCIYSSWLTMSSPACMTNSNIAKGFDRRSDKEFSNFLAIARD
jgi:hypothetical protein